MPDRGDGEIKCSQVQEGFKAEGIRDYRRRDCHGLALQ